MTYIEEITNRVIKRMTETDDYIVRVQDRYYWANTKASGILIDACYSEEVLAIHTLIANGDTRIITQYKLKFD